MLTVALAVVLPLGFLILQRATMYDGVRHVLFVIPMLAVVAGLGWSTLLPLLKRAPVVSAVAVGAYVGGVVCHACGAASARIRGDERAHRRNARRLRQIRARLLVGGSYRGLAAPRAAVRL